jgi:sulfur carrier protein
VRVVVNGETLDLDGAPSVRDVVTRVESNSARGGLAVALNGEVVPRAEWDRTSLEPGDRVEVLNAVGGG